VPVGKGNLGGESGGGGAGGVVLSRMETVLLFGSPQLNQVSVAVDVADADGDGVTASREGDLGGESGGGGSCGGGVEQDGDGVAVLVRRC
jgi:hypothetical protein